MFLYCFPCCSHETVTVCMHFHFLSIFLTWGIFLTWARRRTHTHTHTLFPCISLSFHCHMSISSSHVVCFKRGLDSRYTWLRTCVHERMNVWYYRGGLEAASHCFALASRVTFKRINVTHSFHNLGQSCTSLTQARDSWYDKSTFLTSVSKVI